MSVTGELAYWCPTCQRNRTMANESRSTQREAVEVARRRGVLLRPIRGGHNDH
jgi:transposase-like protein